MKNVVTKRKSNGSRRVVQFCTDESRTEQSHRRECNINTIVAKAKKTGLFPQRTDRPRYGDFTGIVDYHEALTRVGEAKDDFMKLPSEIRSRFDNDPGKLVAFISDPENRSEAERLGLVPRTPGGDLASPERTETTPGGEDGSNASEPAQPA